MSGLLARHKFGTVLAWPDAGDSAGSMSEDPSRLQSGSGGRPAARIWGERDLHSAAADQGEYSWNLKCIKVLKGAARHPMVTGFGDTSSSTYNTQASVRRRLSRASDKRKARRRGHGDLGEGVQMTLDGHGHLYDLGRPASAHVDF